jgi:hypothetical protein
MVLGVSRQPVGFLNDDQINSFILLAFGQEVLKSGTVQVGSALPFITKDTGYLRAVIFSIFST